MFSLFLAIVDGMEEIVIGPSWKTLVSMHRMGTLQYVITNALLNYPPKKKKIVFPKFSLHGEVLEAVQNGFPRYLAGQEKCSAVSM